MVSVAVVGQVRLARNVCVGTRKSVWRVRVGPVGVIFMALMRISRGQGLSLWSIENLCAGALADQRVSRDKCLCLRRHRSEDTFLVEAHAICTAAVGRGFKSGASDLWLVRANSFSFPFAVGLAEKLLPFFSGNICRRLLCAGAERVVGGSTAAVGVRDIADPEGRPLNLDWGRT